jgi:hypothetical protein
LDLHHEYSRWQVTSAGAPRVSSSLRSANVGSLG